MNAPGAARTLRLAPNGRLADPLEAPRLTRLMTLLNRGGEETRVIGGAVRNALLGAPPGDIDLATTALPDTVMARAKAARLRTIPTGLAHGTVTVMVDAHPFEVTTLREDIATDGRHALVRFGRDFPTDARRRDFTINALSLGLDGVVHDTEGGLDDLAMGRVRFIGDPRTRIREDYLRILRFFRFHASYGLGPLDRDGLAAASRERDGLARLSRERVRSEVLKLLAAPGASAVLAAMAATGILDAILGEAADIGRFDRLVAAQAAAAVEANSPPEARGGDAILRLAALTKGDPPLLQDRLRLSNAETARIAAAHGAARMFARSGGEAPDVHGLRVALFEHGRDATRDGLFLALAERESTAPAAWLAATRLVGREPVPQLPFSGTDLVARGLRGPAIGPALARLKQAWSEAGFPQDPEALAPLLENAARDGEDQSTS